MSKNLGNIPNQVKMSEEQQQTFTNGVNKGRKLENARIIKILKEMQNVFADPRYSTTGGFSEIFALKQAMKEIEKDVTPISKLREGNCCAMCAWDINGICCCIPERKERAE